MHPALTATLFALLAPAIANAVYYAAVIVRITAGRTKVPTLRQVLATAPDTDNPPPICVIVPAHNEERSIARIAQSLKDHDHPNLRAVFALDRCTDQTLPILQQTLADDPRFEIVQITHCPDDWAGKVHAMHTAYTTAQAPRDAELLLFADADTWLEPGALRAATHHLQRDNLQLLSLLPTLTADDPWERLAQPACAFELVRQYPLDLVNRTNKRRAFANGQFMLFTKDAYQTIGTHEPFRHELLEDIAIARDMVDKRKLRVGCLIADRLVHCKMYATDHQFRRGWKRIFTEAARRAPARLRKHARVVLATGTLLPIATLLAAIAAAAVILANNPQDPLPTITLAVATLSLTLALFAAASIYRTQYVPILDALAYPYAAFRTNRILRAAANDLDTGRKTHWGGKSYARTARGKGVQPHHARPNQDPAP